MPHTDLPPCSLGDGIREGRENRQSLSLCLRAETVLCPRRHRRDLSPPLRPPKAEPHPPNGSMNVFLVDSRVTGALALLSLCAPQAPTIPSGSLVNYCE